MFFKEDLLNRFAVLLYNHRFFHSSFFLNLDLFVFFLILCMCCIDLTIKSMKWNFEFFNLLYILHLVMGGSMSNAISITVIL